MKIWKIILLMLIFLVGCEKAEQSDLLFDKYEAAYEDLVSSDKFNSFSAYFDVETVVNKLDTNQFRIDTIIDNPKVAMYNVQVIVEINSNGVKQYKEVLPSLGIVDQSTYHLIPFQVNKDAGFYGGLVISGVSTQAEGEIILKINWTDYAETKNYEEFLELSYGKTLEGVDEEAEALVEEDEEESDGE